MSSAPATALPQGVVPSAQKTTTLDYVRSNEVRLAHGEKFDLSRLLDRLKTLSVIGSAAAGLGLLLLYLFGIVIYSTMSRFLGVPAFEFGLNKCLEAGGSFVVLFLGLLVPAILGGAGYVWTSDPGQQLLLALPFLLSLPALAFNRQGTGGMKLRLAEIGLLLALISTMILLIWVHLSIAEVGGQPKDVLTDRTVNAALERLDALRRGTSPADLGIHGWWPLTVELVTSEEPQRYRRYALYVVESSIGLLYALLLVPYARRFIANVGKERPRRGAALARARRSLIVVSLVFAAILLVTLPAIASVSLASTAIFSRVDAEIEGLAAITSRYDLLLISQLGDAVAFHVPPLQQVIVVPEKQVQHMVLKEKVSLFEPRYLFVKGPWLGVRGYFLFPEVEPSDLRRPASAFPATGFRVTRVTAGSPAAAADLQAGDVLLRLGEVRLDAKIPFSEVLRDAPQDREVGLQLRRGGATMEVAVRLEPRP